MSGMDGDTDFESETDSELETDSESETDVSEEGERVQARVQSEAIPRITLDDEQIGILKKRLPKFKSADLAGKKDIVNELAETLKKGWRQEYGDFIRKPVENSIRQYLFNASKRRLKRSDFNPRKNWTPRDVLIHYHRDEITAIACKMSNSLPGSSEYLACYPPAVRRMKKRVGKKTLVRYAAEAKSWSAEVPSRSQQCRTFGTHGLKSMQNFARSSYKEFGVRMVIFAGYQQTPEDANPTISCFDFNDRFGGGTSFERSHQNWHEEAIFQDFADWVIEAFGGSRGDRSETARPKTNQTPKIELETDNDGYPLLPNWEDVCIMKLKYKKMLIGKFVGDTYELSTGRRNARVPWKKIEKSPTEYIKEKYLPEEACLGEVHHMRLDDVNAHLEHWTNRQAAGKKPFRFKNLKRTARHGNKTVSDKDDDDWEDANEEDERSAEGSNRQSPRRSNLRDKEHNKPGGDDDDAAEGDSSPSDLGGGAGSRRGPHPRRVLPGETVGGPSTEGPSNGESGDTVDPSLSRETPTNRNTDNPPQRRRGPITRGRGVDEPAGHTGEDLGEEGDAPDDLPGQRQEQGQGSPGAATSANADAQESDVRRTRARSNTATDANPGKRQRVGNKVGNSGNKRRSDRKRKPSRRALER